MNMHISIPAVWVCLVVSCFIYQPPLWFFSHLDLRPLDILRRKFILVSASRWVLALLNLLIELKYLFEYFNNFAFSYIVDINQDQLWAPHHGQRWGHHPIRQGDGEPEAQQMSAEGLCTGLLSGHAWSGWWRGGNAAASLFGAREVGGAEPSRANHGAENEEREEEDDIDVDLSSPCPSERHRQPITCFLTTSSDADGHLTCCWW